jgi:hypothetical protein
LEARSILTGLILLLFSEFDTLKLSSGEGEALFEFQFERNSKETTGFPKGREAKRRGKELGGRREG